MNMLMLLLALNVTNGKVQPISSLRAAPANGWVAYAMTVREPLRISCCDGWNGGVSCNNCSLDREGSTSISRREDGDIGPAGDRQVMLFVKLVGGEIDRVRVFSPSCVTDAGGQSVAWVENVSQADSIAFLRSAVEHGERKSRNGALFALSLHEGGTDTLVDIARNHPESKVRGEALFWLSQQAGRKAAGALRDAVDNDPEESVRAKAVFGIAQLPDDESIPLLVDLMKTNRSREVRKKAAFWLGQKNDSRALAAIADILRH